MERHARGQVIVTLRIKRIRDEKRKRDRVLASIDCVVIVARILSNPMEQKDRRAGNGKCYFYAALHSRE